MSHQSCLKRGKKRLLLLWLDAIKIAIIEEQYEHLALLCEEIPPLATNQEIEKAQILITQALSTIKLEQHAMQETMTKIKKNAAFLSQEKKKSRLCTLT